VPGDRDRNGHAASAMPSSADEISARLPSVCRRVAEAQPRREQGSDYAFIRMPDEPVCSFGLAVGEALLALAPSWLNFAVIGPSEALPMRDDMRTPALTASRMGWLA